MKKLLFATVALAAFAASPALAADLRRPPPPAYKAPPPVVSYYNWSGCYFGGHAGGLFARKEWTDAPSGFGLGSHDADSWLAGVQAGCNIQFGGGWVLGIQGDYAWTDADGSNVDVFGFTNHSQIKSLASVTGRVGYAWDRFLPYVKGGGAWERDNYDFAFGGVTLATASETRSGWTVGVGGEYAFTDFLTGFIEYNYYDFGTRSNTFSDGSIIDIKETKNVVKGGLNFKFGGWGAPVAAKY
jgi:outer membrane immunogenic protein